MMFAIDSKEKDVVYSAVGNEGHKKFSLSLVIESMILNSIYLYRFDGTLQE